uniref:hypothetical protein n=1 Tax=Pararhizobium sp. IMCC3301 TaxID=3067904 RepID=UPI002741B3E5|nr:hypothetical protein [Pararhizobium sp. IMCC3301]
MPSQAQNVVSLAMTTLPKVEISCVLKARIEDHRKNLTDLASSLLASGQEAKQVQLTIETVLNSFNEELARTISSLKEDTDAL